MGKKLLREVKPVECIEHKWKMSGEKDGKVLLTCQCGASTWSTPQDKKESTESKKPLLME